MIVRDNKFPIANDGNVVRCVHGLGSVNRSQMSHSAALSIVFEYCEMSENKHRYQ